MEINSESGPEVQKQSVRELIRRILPDIADTFKLYNVPSENGYDVFELQSDGNTIMLGGSGGVAWASGLHWYLKYYCNVHLSWCGDQLRLPHPLPKVRDTFRRVSPHKYRYYLNYCTFSYSMAWWDWKRWEREIDLMALNGINMPLSVVGHEAIWQKLLLDFGLTNSEVYEFFAGPAYRAWGWMGNIENWGGPLSQNWIDDQMKLQKQILKRQRDLGMQPVLHSFSGHIPQKFKSLFPDARVDQLPSWYGYPGNHFLDPNDPLFKKMCSKYMKHQRELYGTNHFYTTDLFHEIDLPDNNQEELSRVSKALLDAILENDPKAVWIMQSWSLREKILDNLPPDHILILDLYCDSDPKWRKTNAFYGKPWIWCMLHNFGGRTGMSGDIRIIANDPVESLNHLQKGCFKGIGVAPEGIENNPVIYDLMAEMAWHDAPVDLDRWIKHYTERRYGMHSESILEAWKILLQTVYTGPASYGPMESEICARPAMDIKNVSSNGSTEIYYDPFVLAEAWPLFLKDSEHLAGTRTYMYDLIDLSRQIMVDYGRILYRRMMEAVTLSDYTAFESSGQEFLTLILDLDHLLETEEHFLFGKWLNDARNKGKTPKEMKLLEWNASTQVTLWSSPEITEFHDYANKQWAGLLEDYYHKRWEMFIEAMLFAMREGQPFDEKRFNKQILEWEARWPFFNHQYPFEPRSDGLETAIAMYKKYHPLIECAKKKQQAV